MKISVIIPVYNGEKYIAQCIENVLCQTYKNIEIIVVNDGSKDRSGEIAASYPGVKVITQENAGLSLSRNRGAAEATGDYIHFLDVDDYTNRDYYRKMVDAIDGTGADLAFGDYIDEAKKGLSMVFDDRLVLTNLEDKFYETRIGLYAYAWRYLIRRAFWEEQKLEFIPGRLMEDMPFSLEAIRLSHRIVTVPGATYHYKKRNGSILNSNNKEFIKKREEHWRLARQFRREFMAQNGLGDDVVVLVERFEYKLLGISAALKKEVFNHGKIKWYLFGIPVMRKKSGKI